MTRFLAGFWPFRATSPTVSPPPETLAAAVVEPPTPVRTAPFDSAQIAIKLRPFGISEAELDHLSSVIKSDEALEQMLSLLKANRREQLDQLIGPLADQWSNSTKQSKKFLLAGQALVGMALIHPAFESVCGLLNNCDGFGDLLNKHLSEPGANKHFAMNIWVDENQDLLLRWEEVNFNYSSAYGAEQSLKFPFDLAASAGERHFWIRFCEEMCTARLTDKTPAISYRLAPHLDSYQRVGIDLTTEVETGTFITYASRIASADTIDGAHEVLKPWSATLRASASPVSDRIFHESDVIDRLSQFRLASSELNFLATIIKDRSLLEKMEESLRANRRVTLKKRVFDLASSWQLGAQTDGRVLLACQALVGTELVHPAFEPIAGLINVCGGFGDILDNLAISFTFNTELNTERLDLMFDRAHDLTVRTHWYNNNNNNCANYTLPFSVASKSGEREFWISFSRKMTERLFTGGPTKTATVTCIADAGTFATFASRMTAEISSAAQVDNESTEQART